MLAMVFQGVHLQMCGEVLRCLGSDTSVHIWTSPRSYAQRRLLHTSCQAYHNTMINENDACRNDLRLFSPLFLHPRLLSCYCSLSGVGWLFLFSSLFAHPRLVSCNAFLRSVIWLLQTPHYRIGTPCCLIKSLGLILQPAPLLLLLMVLTHDVDYVDSKN